MSSALYNCFSMSFDELNSQLQTGIEQIEHAFDGEAKNELEAINKTVKPMPDALDAYTNQFVKIKNERVPAAAGHASQAERAIGEAAIIFDYTVQGSQALSANAGELQRWTAHAFNNASAAASETASLDALAGEAIAALIAAKNAVQRFGQAALKAESSIDETGIGIFSAVQEAQRLQNGLQ